MEEASDEDASCFGWRSFVHEAGAPDAARRIRIDAGDPRPEPPSARIALLDRSDWTFRCGRGSRERSDGYRGL